MTRRSTVRQQRLPGATFEQVDLTGSRFEQVMLVDATIHGADASGLEVREVHLSRARFRGADGFRGAWDVVEELWADTVERARRLGAAGPALLHERVDDEWSFIDTLRHLAMATECWLLKVVQGDPAPWHPLSLPTEDGGDTEDIPCDRPARPSLDEALAYRHDRMAAVRRHLDALTDDDLASRTEPVEAPGGPRPDSYPVAQALQVILDEEWWHRQFALRDLAVLEQRV